MTAMTTLFILMSQHLAVKTRGYQGQGNRI